MFNVTFSLPFRTSFRFALPSLPIFWLGPSFGDVTASSPIGPVLHVPLTSGRSGPQGEKKKQQKYEIEKKGFENEGGSTVINEYSTNLAILNVKFNDFTDLNVEDFSLHFAAT